MSEIKQVLGFDASGAIAELQKLDSAMRQLQGTMQNTAGAFRSFNAGNVSKQFSTLTAASNTAATQVQSNVVRMTTSLQLLSRVVFTQTIVRALSTLRNSFKATAAEAANFQRGLSLIQTIDDSKQSFDALSASVRKLSDEFNIPLNEAVAGVYQAISNQVGDAAQSLEFSASAAKFATATNSSLSNSVDLLSGVLKSFNVNVSETDRIAGVFFKTIDLGRVEANELANTFGRIGPRAADLGISIEETGAALSSLTVRGLKTSEAITQLSGIMSALLKPSKAMQAALADIGVDSGEAAIQSFGLFGTLEKLKTASGGTASSMAALFPNVRALGGATSLLGDGLRSATSNLVEMKAAGDDLLDQKFGQAIANDGETVRREFNKIKNAFVVEVGGALLETTKNFFQATSATEGLTKAIVAAKPAVDNITGAMALLIGQLSAAKLGAVGLSRALGALALVPLAQGAGELIGESLNDAVSSKRNESLRALEGANAAELQSFSETQRKKIEAARAADNQIVESTRRVAGALNKAFSANQVAAQFDASPFITALEKLGDGRQIQSANGLAVAIESVAKKADELRLKLAEANKAAEQVGTVRGEIDEALGSIRGDGHGFAGDFASGLKSQLEQLKVDLAALAQSSNITEEQLNQLIAKRNQFGKAAFEGENPLVGKLGFAQDVQQLDQALAKLQQLKTLQAQATPDPALQANLTRLEAVLAQNPAGQFSGAATAMNQAVGPAQLIAAAWERAAAAAERAMRAASATPKNKAFGGMSHLASGGFARGIDTIPAMLSPGEFVMNARSSRQFFSQLQAINAGQTPAFRENGGSVTDNSTTIGDIHLHSNPTSTRELMKDIRREQRRGTGRLG